MVLDPGVAGKSALQQEAKAVAARLLTLARELFAPDDKLVADLPLGQLRVCGILFRGRQTMSALSRELGISLSAMTQIADRLERARLVKRIADGADRRMKYLQLTERGEKIMRTRDESRIRRVSRVLERLSVEARDAVLAALETLTAQCAAIQAQQQEATEFVYTPNTDGASGGLPALGGEDREERGFSFSEVKALP